MSPSFGGTALPRLAPHMRHSDSEVFCRERHILSLGFYRGFEFGCARVVGPSFRDKQGAGLFGSPFWPNWAVHTCLRFHFGFNGDTAVCLSALSAYFCSKCAEAWATVSEAKAWSLA